MLGFISELDWTDQRSMWGWVGVIYTAVRPPKLPTCHDNASHSLETCGRFRTGLPHSGSCRALTVRDSRPLREQGPRPCGPVCVCARLVCPTDMPRLPRTSPGSEASQGKNKYQVQVLGVISYSYCNSLLSVCVDCNYVLFNLSTVFC